MLIQDIVPKPFYNAQDLHGKKKEEIWFSLLVGGNINAQVREAELADRESVVSHMKTWAGLWWLSWPMKMT
jgi:hypothetical protein